MIRDGICTPMGAEPKRLYVPDRIRLALQAKPMSRRDLEAMLKVSRGSITNGITRMHLDGEVHIAHWIEDVCGRPNTPVYALGDERDAPAPPSRGPRGYRRSRVDLSGAPRFRSVFANGRNPWTGEPAGWRPPRTDVDQQTSTTAHRGGFLLTKEQHDQIP